MEAGVLYRFVHGIGTGDFVIYPSKHDRMVNIGKFTGEMVYEPVSARVTQKSGDGGIDVIAHNDKLGFEPPIIKVQCKRTTNQIGETQIRELLGTLVEGEYGLFVTLGAYERKARLSERNLSKLRLIDGEQLFELVVKHYAQLSPRYRTMIPLRQIYVPDLR